MKTGSGSRALGKPALLLLLFAVILIAGCTSQGGAQGLPVITNQTSHGGAQGSTPTTGSAVVQAATEQPAGPTAVITQKPAEVKAAVCGNGVKEQGENSDTCCPDAGCPATFTCGSAIVNGSTVFTCANVGKTGNNGVKAETNANATPTLNLTCTSPFSDTARMDIFDAHAHITPQVSASQIISEMDKAGVSVANVYSVSLEALSQYPGRFIAFVDTPDRPQPSTWFTQGQAFVTSAQTQLKTGKFSGIGETNLRYYGGSNNPPGVPDIYVAPDTPLWLKLVDLSAQYHVPISFHFVPDDPVANAAFERMLGYNKNAVLIWAHLGFNNLPLNRATLNDFLLRYPNLYFDTAGIQNMQNPLPLPNSNWAVLANQSNNGRLNEEWRQFFETWNSRILFGSDAGGGSNGLERWLNYADNTVDGATPNAVGHWTRLLSNLDDNAARNILSANARTLFLHEQKPPYTYRVASNGTCYAIAVSSNSSISGLTFDPNTRTVTFTAAGSLGTTGVATVTIPKALVAGNVTAQGKGQSVPITETASNATDTTLRVDYPGGIQTVTLRAPNNTPN